MLALMIPAHDCPRCGANLASWGVYCPALGLCLLCGADLSDELVDLNTSCAGRAARSAGRPPGGITSAQVLGGQGTLHTLHRDPPTRTPVGPTHAYVPGFPNAHQAGAYDEDIDVAFKPVRVWGRCPSGYVTVPRMRPVARRASIS